MIDEWSRASFRATSISLGGRKYMKKIHDSIKNNFSSLSIFRYTHDRSFFKSFFRLTKIPKQPLSFRPIPEPNTPYIPQKFNKNDDLPIPPSSLSREK